MRFLPLLALGALACARSAPPTPASVHVPALRYSVQLDARFDTTATGGGLGPWAEAAPFSERWALELETAPGRRYRDHSVGEVLWIRSATVDAGQGPAPHPLAGHFVTVRRFASGEILAVEDAEHAVGGDRQLEVLDLLLPALSPKVPVLRKGESVTWNTRWPLQLAGDLRQKGLLRLTWTLEALTRWQEVPAWALTYEGDWLTRIQAGGGDRRSWVTTESPGQAEGALWLSRDDGGVLRHEFTWTRDATWAAPEDPEARVVQRQAFTGQVVRR